jgi:hypothetical protein
MNVAGAGGSCLSSGLQLSASTPLFPLLVWPQILELDVLPTHGVELVLG